MITLAGDSDALKGNHRIRSHIWFLGGWTKYVILCASSPWRVGWIVPDGKDGEICEVSRIVINRRVKMLVGPQTRFFAIEENSGYQIHLSLYDNGRLGKDDRYRDVLFL